MKIVTRTPDHSTVAGIQAGLATPRKPHKSHDNFEETSSSYAAPNKQPKEKIAAAAIAPAAGPGLSLGAAALADSVAVRREVQIMSRLQHPVAVVVWYVYLHVDICMHIPATDSQH